MSTEAIRKRKRPKIRGDFCSKKCDGADVLNRIRKKTQRKIYGSFRFDNWMLPISRFILHSAFFLSFGCMFVMFVFAVAIVRHIFLDFRPRNFCWPFGCIGTRFVDRYKQHKGQCCVNSEATGETNDEKKKKKKWDGKKRVTPFIHYSTECWISLMDDKL